MLFSTFTFFIFFAVFLILNWLLKRIPLLWRIFLLATSYFFYATWNVRFLFLIIAISLLNFYGGFLIHKIVREKRKKTILALIILINIGILGIFKYYGFFIGSAETILNRIGLSGDFLLLNIVLPVGLSFYILRAISYNIDIFRKKIVPESSIIDFFVYIAFFPQLLAGPIMRAGEFLSQLKNGGAKSIENINESFALILGGLFKKVVIASYLTVNIVDNVFAVPQNHSQIMVLLAIYAFAIVIYCDFSGYSDIAIGLSGLMGFKSPINFNAPYLALNFQDFWQRWHITFSSWLRDYVYIPLGGNRKGKIRTYINLMATMFVSGLWHGAGLNFIIWGLLHGLGLAANRAKQSISSSSEKKTNSFFKIFFAWFITFNAISFFWIFFRADSIQNALEIIKQLFNWQSVAEPIEIYAIFLIIFSFVIFAVGKRIKSLFVNLQARLPFLLQVLTIAVLAILIIKLGPDIVPPFIYFKF